MFGYTEEQVSEFFLSYGIGAFMLFIIGELAYKAKAGKRGTLVLFFVLSFGMFGFVVKTVIQKLWGI